MGIYIYIYLYSILYIYYIYIIYIYILYINYMSIGYLDNITRIYSLYVHHVPRPWRMSTRMAMARRGCGSGGPWRRSGPGHVKCGEKHGKNRENMGKIEKKHGKNREIMGKTWEKHGKNMGKIGKTWET